jgi:hypothetical protein
MTNDKERSLASIFFNPTSLAAICIILVLVASIVTAPGLLLPKNVYAQNNWYVGKGAKPNMYVTYRIQNHDTNQGQPFLMTIYFKQFDNKSMYWIAPVFVVDKGKVINGTFHLSDLDLSVLGSSKIPPELSPYRSAYTSSLQWLAAFVPKPGQSLSAPYWGKIASIGGSPISPDGRVKVTVPAGTFDTVLVSYHKGVDNNIWVNPDFPYPIKAQTFADVTTGNPPVQYSFELLATGQGQPPEPKSMLEIPKTPLTLQTQRGTYFIRLYWDPPVIEPGNTTKFGILFMDRSQSVLNQVTYDFVVKSSNDTVLKEVKDQKAPQGTGVQSVKFNQSGPATITINVVAVGGNPMGEFVESADFGIIVAGSQIVPEFPTGMVLAVTAMTIGFVLLFGRSRLNLFGARRSSNTNL